jgi:hypothetical protein
VTQRRLQHRWNREAHAVVVALHNGGYSVDELEFYLWNGGDSRAIPPQGTALWPALWLLGANCQATNIYTADVGYSTCPYLYTSNYVEIDMVECMQNTWCQLAMAQTNGWPTCS